MGFLKLAAVAVMFFSFTTSNAFAYERLEKAEMERLLPGSTFNLRMFENFDLVFFRNGTFKVGHHKACSNGEKSKYTVGRGGRLKIDFRVCNGRYKSTLYLVMYKRNGQYYVKHRGVGDYFYFRKR